MVKIIKQIVNYMRQEPYTMGGDWVWNWSHGRNGRWYSISTYKSRDQVQTKNHTCLGHLTYNFV